MLNRRKGHRRGARPKKAIPPSSGSPKAVLSSLAAIAAILTFSFVLHEQILNTNSWFQCLKADHERRVIVVAEFSGEASETDARIFRVLTERVASMKLDDRVQVLRFESISPANETEAEQLADSCGADLLVWGIADPIGLDVFHTKLKGTGLIPLDPGQSLSSPSLDQSVPDREALRFYIQSGVPLQFDYLMLLTVGQLALFTNQPDVAERILDAAVQAGESLAESLTQYQSQPDTDEPDLCLTCTYFYRANAHYYLGNYDQALRDLNRVLADDPRDVFALHNRADVYFALGRHEDALQGYEEAINLAISMPRAASIAHFSYNNRGVLRSQLGMDDLAISDFVTALELNANYAVPYFNLAGYYESIGNRSLAFWMLSRALTLDPEYANALLARGRSLYAAGDYRQALQDFSEFLQLADDSATGYYERGNTYDELGMYSLAVRDLETAVALAPDFAEAHNNLGLTVLKQGRYEASIPYFERAILINPAFVGPYINEVRAYEMMDEYTSALDVLTRALAAGVDEATVFLARARIHAASGDTSAADSDYRRTMSLVPPSDPNYAAALQRLLQLKVPADE